MANPLVSQKVYYTFSFLRVIFSPEIHNKIPIFLDYFMKTSGQLVPPHTHTCHYPGPLLTTIPRQNLYSVINFSFSILTLPPNTMDSRVSFTSFFLYPPFLGFAEIIQYFSFQSFIRLFPCRKYILFQKPKFCLSLNHYPSKFWYILKGLFIITIFISSLSSSS